MAETYRRIRFESAAPMQPSRERIKPYVRGTGTLAAVCIAFSVDANDQIANAKELVAMCSLVCAPSVLQPQRHGVSGAIGVQPYLNGVWSFWHRGFVMCDNHESNPTLMSRKLGVNACPGLLPNPDDYLAMPEQADSELDAKLTPPAIFLRYPDHEQSPC